MRIVKTVLAAMIVAIAGYGGLVLSDRWLTATGEAMVSPPDAAALRVDTVPVTMATFSETVRAVGTTRAIRAVDLTPQAAGRIVQIGFTPGGTVARGDLLLQLDDRAERADLKAAEATLAEARASFDRQQRLHRAGSASDAVFQGAQAALLRAEAARELAQVALEDRRLIAPFDGVIGLSDLVEGEWIDSSTSVATLDDLSVIEVAFRVPETLLPRLRHGQRVNLTTAAWPDRVFQAGLSGIDSRIEAQSRSVALRATIDNADRALAGGMFMQVELVLEEYQRPTIPERALSVDGPREMVMLADGGVARQIEIATGQIRGGLVEVLSGLDSPDTNTDAGPASGPVQIIVSNLQRVRDGMAIDATPLVQSDMSRVE